MNSTLTTTTESSYSSERVANIDRLRIFAAFGIVWFHTESVAGRGIGYSGLIIFLLVFCSLIVTHSELHGPGDFVKRRARRLLIPWLFWSAVYGLLKLGKALVLKSPISATFRTPAVLVGTHIHLWYLPYAFIAAVCIYLLARHSSSVPLVVAAGAAALTGVIALPVCSTLMSSVAATPPFPQWLFGLAAIPLGFAIGQCRRVSNVQIRQCLLAMISLAVLAECLSLKVLGHRHLTVQYAVAVPLVCGAYLWQGRQDRISQALAPLAYGIYLVHPLVSYSPGLLSKLTANPWVQIVTVFAVSAILASILRATPLRRFV